MARHLLAWTGLLLSVAVAEQPGAPKPIAGPMRELPWGHLNFLQTTDTHGWHSGHLQEAQYSADWGDYISFAERMHEKADDLGVDLLLIDTGDRIEGNGLYDGSEPKGEYTYDIFREQNIDVITPGNHELYQLDAAAREYEISIPNFKDTYLASNLDYNDPASGLRVPMAQRYRKFTTKNRGIRVLAFGFIFDFTGSANNTIVQPVKDTIKESWFQSAIREDVDLFLVAGHVTLEGPEYNAIFKAIRAQNPDIPIQFFGGHSHIRDFFKYDSKAYGVQSGRYMETIGFMSITGVGENHQAGEIRTIESPKSMSFQRRYIDNNLFGYHHHTGLNSTTFPTEHGQNVSSLIHKARKALKLDTTYGCAPKDLWLNRAPYPSNDSLLTWLETEVLPDIVVRKDREHVPRLAITNSGAMRFDVFKGAFTKDTTYIVSPFISRFLYLKDVPYRAARSLITLLNNNGPILHEYGPSPLAPQIQVRRCFEVLGPHDVTPHNSFPAGEAQSPLLASPEIPALVPGYTTKDDGGTDGDDTIHAPITFYRVPNCLQAEIAFPDSDPVTVDVVFGDFVQPWILAALRINGLEYHASDVSVYREEPMTELMAGWIQENWGSDC